MKIHSRLLCNPPKGRFRVTCWGAIKKKVCGMGSGKKMIYIQYIYIFICSYMWGNGESPKKCYVCFLVNITPDLFLILWQKHQGWSFSILISELHLVWVTSCDEFLGTSSHGNPHESTPTNGVSFGLQKWFWVVWKYCFFGNLINEWTLREKNRSKLGSPFFFNQ